MAIIMALSMVALCVVAGMVVDLGLLRVDRQSDKAAADAAALAGVNGLVPDISSPSIHPFAGVCQALHYLQANDPDFETLSSSTWYKGDGSPLGADGCSASFASATCTPGNASTWAKFMGVSSDRHTRVTIQSGYSLQNSGFSEDNDAVFSGDGDDPTQQGCDQLAVIMSVARGTTLGSPATSTMGTALRSVARVVIQDGNQAPALLLLEQKNCGVLVVNSSGATSLIHVFGSGTTPGTIHADSNATGAGCGSGSNEQLFQGSQTDAIVAYGANGSSGSITSVAGRQGSVGAGTISDNSLGVSDRVYGTTATAEGVAGTVTGPTGRDLVTRGPVDSRYRAGIRSLITSATTQNYLNASSAPGIGWKSPACTGAAINAANLQPSDSVYLNCGPSTMGTGSSPVVIHGKNIIFNGWFKSGGISMPDAQYVYVLGASGNPAINITNGNAFCVRGPVCDVGGAASACPTGQQAATDARATVIAKTGGINMNGGLLRLCNTTAIFLSGQPSDGCVPTADGTAPTAVPCSGGASTGDAQFSFAGSGTGIQDWTAPNHWDVIPDADKPTAWSTYFEDLALWDESYGGKSSPTFSMAGGGNTHTQGVFMVPNASPFTVTGGGVQNLVNAQYIADSVVIKGGAQLKMTVDHNAAVSLPSISFYMVR